MVGVCSGGHGELEDDVLAFQVIVAVVNSSIGSMVRLESEVIVVSSVLFFEEGCDIPEDEWIQMDDGLEGLEGGGATSDWERMLVSSGSLLSKLLVEVVDLVVTVVLVVRGQCQRGQRDGAVGWRGERHIWLRWYC